MSIEISRDKSLGDIKKFCDLDQSKIKSLEDFVLLLLQENHKFNFIGESTIQNIWQRHILDSAQLLRFIDNKNLKIADFGSGAGFPGLILSILGVKEIHLIEKSFRKFECLIIARILSQNRQVIHKK
jgi:16S rRNA (guanine527-N7)-methyltransferase